MASLLVSLLEEEASGARLPRNECSGHAGDRFDASSSQSAEPETSPDGGGLLPLAPVPGKAFHKRRAARRVYSNLSRREGNPFLAAPHTAEAPSSVDATSGGRRSERHNHQERSSSTGVRACRGIFPSLLQSRNECPGCPSPSRGNTSTPPSGNPRPLHETSLGNASPRDGGGPCCPEKGAPFDVCRRADSFAAQRERLPLWRHRGEVQLKVKEHQVTLIVGETGSGKTTQIPQLLLQWGVCPGGWIAISQPRRVAAVSLARRVSKELGDPEVGGLVGYKVRFESKLSSRTRICFMTDGMLVREALADPKLKRFSALVLDEVHERALQTDFLLGVAKVLVEERPDLKVVLMSATMETERLRHFFPKAVMVSIPGVAFPLKTLYAPEPQEDFLEARKHTYIHAHVHVPERWRERHGNSM